MRPAKHLAQVARGRAPRCGCRRADRQSSSSRMRGCAQQRAGERHALLLAAREGDAALADHGLEAAAGSSRDRPSSPASRRRFEDLGAARLGPAEGDVRRRSWPRRGRSPAAPWRSRRAARRAGSRARRGRRANSVPGGGSTRRGSSASSVRLPAPVRPTTPPWSPAGTSRSRPESAGGRARRGSGSRASRSGSRRAIARRGRRRPAASAIAGAASRTSRMRAQRGRAALREVDHPADGDHRPDQLGRGRSGR